MHIDELCVFEEVLYKSTVESRSQRRVYWSQVPHLLLICFTEWSRKFQCSPTFFNYPWKKGMDVYLFFSALNPSAPRILSLQFQGTGWCDRDKVLKFSTKMYFKNTAYIINRIIFCIFFFTGYIFNIAICQLYRNFMFRGLSCEFKKFEVWTFYTHAQWRNFINAINSNFEAKIIERFWIELTPRVGFLSHNYTD